MSPPMTSNIRSIFGEVFQRVVVEPDESLSRRVEHRLTVCDASRTDGVGAGFPCELRHHRPDGAGRAVHKDALARVKAAVLEQSLPRGHVTIH
jgi:hypothetical protein